MISVTRLSKVVEVVRFWEFLSDGIDSAQRYLKYDLTLDIYRKILFRLVKTPYSSWVGVALDDYSCPLGFVVAHEVTPIFSRVREFEVSLFYHLPGRKDCIPALQQKLDNFCKSNDIKCYYVTTSRKCGSSSRVFGEEWSGLKRAYTVFKKNV